MFNWSQTRINILYFRYKISTAIEFGQQRLPTQGNERAANSEVACVALACVLGREILLNMRHAEQQPFGEERFETLKFPSVHYR